MLLLEFQRKSLYENHRENQPKVASTVCQRTYPQDQSSTGYSAQYGFRNFKTFILQCRSDSQRFLSLSENEKKLRGKKFISDWSMYFFSYFVDREYLFFFEGIGKLGLRVNIGIGKKMFSILSTPFCEVKKHILMYPFCILCV